MNKAQKIQFKVDRPGKRGKILFRIMRVMTRRTKTNDKI